jgi:hypothetical protein
MFDFVMQMADARIHEDIALDIASSIDSIQCRL